MAIAVPVLVVGLVTGGVSLAVGEAVLGTRAGGLSWSEEMRGVIGCAVCLTLMALLAAGLTALLRSGVATLSILIPFLLIVSFVIGDMSNSLVDGARGDGAVGRSSAAGRGVERTVPRRLTSEGA